MNGPQTKSRQRLTSTALRGSGGHGSRTRNRFPGTTFPVWPLAIRLPSGTVAPERQDGSILAEARGAEKFGGGAFCVGAR
jgi:hypothetical protein